MSAKKEQNKELNFALGRENYILLIEKMTEYWK